MDFDDDRRAHAGLVERLEAAHHFDLVSVDPTHKTNLFEMLGGDEVGRRCNAHGC